MVGTWDSKPFGTGAWIGMCDLLTRSSVNVRHCPENDVVKEGSPHRGCRSVAQSRGSPTREPAVFGLRILLTRLPSQEQCSQWHECRVRHPYRCASVPDFHRVPGACCQVPPARDIEISPGWSHRFARGRIRSDAIVKTLVIIFSINFGLFDATTLRGATHPREVYIENTRHDLLEPCLGQYGRN